MTDGQTERRTSREWYCVSRFRRKTKNKMRIAVVDDDAPTRGFIDQLLTQNGHRCTQFQNGRDIVTALSRDTFDLIMVDWNMPGLSGIEVVQWARQNMQNCPPIIMLTSRMDEKDVIQGLEAGADDYIVKPESGPVILARVAAMFRRAAPPSVTDRFDVFGRYCFDRVTESVTFDDNEIILTSKEFALAKAFFENQHRALSRAYILETIWKSVGDLPTRTLDVHVSRIRTKLKLNPENGYRLQTIFGFGYRLESADEGN
jgi:DNA-binding response OmpR family regulator